jgi:ABC-2 type transport system ATP-binding protein
VTYKEVIIRATNIYKSYKQVKAVDGVDLKIHSGEFLALLGPNGAGKTTLVEMIEGLQNPDKGEILIKNKPWKNNSHELHKILGISLQETKFMDKVTVLETLKLFASFYELPNSRVEEIIDIINLREKLKSYTENLSGGQRQRLTLGVALLNKPEILLLDEPTTGLDPTARREIWSILMKLKHEEKTSMILTTHYMEEAEQLCDRIVIMDHGKILTQGTLTELLSHSKSSEIIEFDLLENFEIFNFLSDEIVELDKNEKNKKITLYVKSIVDILPKILNYLDEKHLSAKNLICRRLTLDDLFISLTGRRLSD